METSSRRASNGIVMLGTDFTAPGGITAVIRAYRDAGLFARRSIHFIPTYRRDTRISKLLTLASALRRFAKQLILRRVAVVHAHAASRGSFWRKAIFLVGGHWAGVATIFHLHSGEFPVFYRDECGPLRQWLIRYVLRSVDRVIVLTEGWVPVIRAIEPAARICVLYNPVMMPPAAAPAETDDQAGRAPVVLFLGRLREKKGVYDLVRAVGLIAADFPGLKLVCAGDGDTTALYECARAAGVEGLITPGWVEGAEKDAWLAHASVFVLPSYFEGLPLGVLEAMAHGVPVVATRVGGIPEAMRDGIDGVLVDPGDIEALAAALKEVLDDPLRARRMRQAARARAAQIFDAPAVVDQLDAIYAEVIEARRQGS